MNFEIVEKNESEQARQPFVSSLKNTARAGGEMLVSATQMALNLTARGLQSISHASQKASDIQALKYYTARNRFIGYREDFAITIRYVEMEEHKYHTNRRSLNAVKLAEIEQYWANVRLSQQSDKMARMGEITRQMERNQRRCV